MSEHHAAIAWRHSAHPDNPKTYSRNHTTRLNGGQSVNLSSSVEFKGDPACADPEQMLVSAVASCHMLTFLAIAEFQGFKVATYEDDAVGYLEKGTNGVMAITRIVLSPAITFSGERIPDEAALARLHAGAHKNCFIGNSIKAEISVLPEPVLA